MKQKTLKKPRQIVTNLVKVTGNFRLTKKLSLIFWFQKFFFFDAAVCESVRFADQKKKSQKQKDYLE